MSKPVYDIKAIDKATHSRTITLEDLIELFKDHCGAPESAQVLFNYHLGDLKKKVEIVWIEDALKKTLDFATEPTYGGHPAETPFEERQSKHPCPPPTINIPVATYNVEVGDLVMVRDYGLPNEDWRGPFQLREIREVGGPRLVEKIKAPDRSRPYIVGTGARRGDGWPFVRHLTDEERAKIKRI